MRVIPQGQIRLGNKVTIECRSSSNTYRLTDCGLYKTNLDSSWSLSGIQYVIESATTLDEANYTCQCNVYSADSRQYRTTELSLPFNLLLNRNLEKPQILVRCMEGINTCSKMMIECRISHYTLKECWFHKDGEGQTRYSNSNINSGIQYVIQSVTSADEGPYTCECNSVQDTSTQTSDPAYLFIKRVYMKTRLQIMTSSSFQCATVMGVTHRHKVSEDEAVLSLVPQSV
ncbi:uncharacterized protein LOC122815406 [Protopterus annectens]|uniref:uncharacterized protein LOC122815406 n=1 Tax=Protopterus annectens TaxID=7888 RepID=UPI001CFBA495|nr:uncharacterized protein LOC122815406 [Protopterus annectens]